MTKKEIITIIRWAAGQMGIQDWDIAVHSSVEIPAEFGEVSNRDMITQGLSVAYAEQKKAFIWVRSGMDKEDTIETACHEVAEVALVDAGFRNRTDQNHQIVYSMGRILSALRTKKTRK